jgi:hypothetical protein
MIITMKLLPKVKSVSSTDIAGAQVVVENRVAGDASVLYLASGITRVMDSEA